MARGDYVRIKSEIGGVLEKDQVTVDQAGGKIEVEWDKKQPLVHVRLLGRTGKIKRTFSYAVSAVRSLEVLNSDDE